MPSSTSAPLRGWRIIVCHDDPAVLQSTTGLLRSAGYAVVQVGDGLSAFRLAVSVSDLAVIIAGSEVRLDGIGTPRLVAMVCTHLPDIATLCLDRVVVDRDAEGIESAPRQIACSPEELLASVGALMTARGSR